jgi:hypothetical protein
VRKKSISHHVSFSGFVLYVVLLGFWLEVGVSSLEMSMDCVALSLCGL